MLSAIVIILFMVYGVILFFITNWYILFALLIIELVITRFNKFLFKNLGFVILVVLANLIYSHWETALLFGTRLFLIIEATYIISRLFSTSEFAHGLCILLSPLRLFRVNLKELELMIMIALAFVPILSREAIIIKRALLAKGFAFNLKNVLMRPHIYVLTYINNLLNRVEAVALALRTKGYE